MKVALVHDYIKEYGGAERVLEGLHKIYPDADVYTTVYLPKFLGPHAARFENWSIKPSILQLIPMKGKMISIFRFVEPIIFRLMDLRSYDLIIVSKCGNYASINSFRKRRGALHICYCHTPPRYLYGYPVANRWDNSFVRKTLFVLGRIPMYFMRKLDYIDGQKPDYFIANSAEIAGRIKKFYARDAIVIHPPIDIPKINIPVPMKDRKYYLTGGRLSRNKAFDLAVVACTKLNLPLKVFGKGFGGYGENDLKKQAGPNVEFLGEVSQAQKWELIKNAKAYISPSLQEDFGMLNLEVNAGGTPVIAYNSGGVKETVIDGKTGVLFDEPNVESIVSAIKRFEKIGFSPETLIIHAKKFSSETFEKEIKRFVADKISK
ncbi:MAG: Glycosyl transferase, group 1 [Candidatus Woesebacteria bacterium GW2011_GWA1_37_8]|uniref:Glycosyl transferase, group 1 n=2 Tax=Candidatus Woeseibacteriota TaxID=1752722 RepID=A0A0G0LHY5_9BACT|nr:MAG: Glycosyl transferase, group 1 [Microgenomates group bacterium GW2011_GWC1_37_12b]KKQ43932.1 MAG: Glycosyl transferase, group 1 [Candidatus Woesebacteria bacterium GW2011_GWA1_37_8]KKQ87560.1 MAG: Glycosyl transferase, group 1 [Candidatus Woesebacteria bacterium GW2011_GWB1_38_8b]